MAHLVKQKKTFYVGPDGKRCGKGTPGAKKVTEESGKWYAANVPGFPRGKRIPLATHRRVAERMLADLIDKGERGMANMTVRDDGKVLLAPLVAEFGEHLGRKSDGKHVKFVLLCVRRVLDGAKLVTVADLLSADAAPRAEAVVWDMTKGKDAVSAPTAARAGKHCRQFTRWLWRKKKAIDHDPLAGMDLPSQAAEGKRRALTPAELAALIDTAEDSERVVRGLTGPERAALYLTAAATGYRVSELAALEPAHFHLDADPPAAVLPGRLTKNGKDASQPLPPGVVARLRPLLAAVAPGDKVWGGSWSERSADVFRDDLAEANIPEVVNGEAAVFHSLRHTYATMLGRSAPIKVVQELARHSTPLLTIGKYSHTDMGEKAEAVARLPLPGSGNVSPFGRLSRADLESYAEGLTTLFAAVWGSVLVTHRVTPEPQTGVDSAGQVQTVEHRDEPGPHRRIA